MYLFCGGPGPLNSGLGLVWFTACLLGIINWLRSYPVGNGTYITDVLEIRPFPG